MPGRQGVDGIVVHCEETIVESNTVVDATDAGIMLYGSYNRPSERDPHPAFGASPATPC